MSKVRSNLWAWVLTTAVAVVFGAHTTPAFSADSIPPNAHPTGMTFGSGWATDGHCLPIEPESSAIGS